MSVDTNSAIPSPDPPPLFRIDDDPIWLRPQPWESFSSHSSPADPRPSHGSPPSAVSEVSLVRLAMNALHGVESALISIEKISEAFCFQPADRTFHKISSLWSRSLSTHALGKLLKVIGRMGSLVFLLQKFVDYFTNVDMDKNLTRYVNSALVGNQNIDCEVREKELPRYSLVNQAFAVAVGKVLEGYLCALDTTYASVNLRRVPNHRDVTRHHYASLGCLTSVVHSEITLLEVFLHTNELRTQIEALGNICSLCHLTSCFPAYAVNDLLEKATSEFFHFPIGGDLLTYLYRQLQVADPTHSALFKFLFIKACEPYCGLIRSWIYKAEISDSYGDFIVANVDMHPLHTNGNAGISIDCPLASIKELGNVSIPCFLKEFINPLVRAGQQLQVLLKLLELCNNASVEDHTYGDFLPSWINFSSSHLSSLTFNKHDIEALVLARDTYYKNMQEKMEFFFTKIGRRCQQVVLSRSSPYSSNSCRHSQTIPELFRKNARGFACSTPDEKGLHMSEDGSNSVNSDSVNEFRDEDTIALSDSSSFNSSDDEIECEQSTEFPHNVVGLKRNFCSVLKFLPSTSGDNLSKIPHQNKEFKNVGFYSSVHRNTYSSSQPLVPHASEEPASSLMLDIDCKKNCSNFCWPLGGLLKNPFSCDGRNDDEKMLNCSNSSLKVTGRCETELKVGTSCSGEVSETDNALEEETPDNNHSNNGNLTNTDLSVNQPWRLKYQFDFLSRNPMLTKNTLWPITSKSREDCSRGLGESFPFIDFSCVEDPCKVFSTNLAESANNSLESELTVSPDLVSATNSKNDCKDAKQERKQHVISLPIEVHEQNALLTDLSGGGNWETLPRRFNKYFSNNGGNRHSILPTFEMPLDFVVDKCLLQEILLQYKYVSKLTIRLLEEGFDLHSHLLALRRYHFMEIADWADLFVMSLWSHKWPIMSAEQRVSEIQGLLEFSIQRSSCDKDHYKDHLYVYLKAHDTMPLTSSSIGINSYDFLGLGYRVDWPISIVLTPKALKIYGDIFSFLIRVKLAIFSLTDVWSSLKDLMHPSDWSGYSRLHKQELRHFNILVRMRHQVNHFVSTLQQYVQSQLSHASWSKFLQSLKHKVKDMMDLESAHMVYLNDALHICFLSPETRSVAHIIGNILQCALDFRSFSAEIWSIPMEEGDVFDKTSKINISQVLAIKEVFQKNIKELRNLYLKSPKHGVLGLTRFWESLNYNEYYLCCE